MATRSHSSQPREPAYQLAWTDLRDGRFLAARQRFEQLMATAPTRAERDFAESQVLWTDLLDGHEEPTVRSLAEADRRGKRSPAYYFLQTALAHHRGQATPMGQRGFAQATATKGQTSATVRRWYADAWRELEDLAPRPDTRSRTDVATSGVVPARVALVEVLARPTPVLPGHDVASPAPTPALAVRPAEFGGIAPPRPAFKTSATENNSPGAAPTPIPEASRRPDPDYGRKESAKAAAAGSPSAPAAPLPPPGRPLAESSAEVRDKFEAAQSLYTRRDCPGALRLLDEIEAIQPNISEVRNLRALLHYELAYRQYVQQDYAGALRELDAADEAQAVADTSNLRGLVLARQRQYDRAEAAFRKAVAADPTLWAAKFNLADLPFGYRNYTEARQRFEALTAETDRATQPRQAELTEFKVFLTLLLEGRESAARSFLSRFKTDGATPARLYAQAALDFHAGRFDRAIESVKDARKKYPPQLEAIFAESFYRVGWLTDGSATPNAPQTAEASPSTTPEVVAAASTPPPEATPPAPDPTPEPTATMVAAAAPTLPPDPVPTPSPSPSPSVAAVVVTTPAPPVLVSTPPEPTPLVVMAPPPPAEVTPPVTASPTPMAVVVPTTAPLSTKTRSPAENFIRQVLPWGVLVYLLAPWLYALRLILNRRRRRLRARRVVPLPRYPVADKTLESEKV